MKNGKKSDERVYALTQENALEADNTVIFIKRLTRWFVYKY